MGTACSFKMSYTSNTLYGVKSLKTIIFSLGHTHFVLEENHTHDDKHYLVPILFPQDFLNINSTDIIY